MFRNRFDVVCCLGLALVFGFNAPVYAEKDFKGLFGSYKPPKFVENEGRDSDFGINFLLSTLIPVTSLVKTYGGTDNLALESPHFATFFNFEIEPYFTVSYNWEFFARIGYYSYGTERQHGIDTDVVPDGNVDAYQFHYFDMTAIPMMIGARRRFGRDDVVPYIGWAGGIVYTERKGSYGYDPSTDITSNIAPMYELMVGAEFFFGSRAGIRVEIGGGQMLLDKRTYDSGFAGLPKFEHQNAPIFMRYSSGLFILL